MDYELATKIFNEHSTIKLTPMLYQLQIKQMAKLDGITEEEAFKNSMIYNGIYDTYTFEKSMQNQE
jgi:hypothetical protein